MPRPHRKIAQPPTQVSFARDIRPLFRAVDISHMARHGIKLDDYTFMSDPDNANIVLGTLSPHEGDYGQWDEKDAGCIGCRRRRHPH